MHFFLSHKERCWLGVQHFCCLANSLTIFDRCLLGKNVCVKMIRRPWDWKWSSRANGGRIIPKDYHQGSKQLNMAIEIVDFPIKNGDFPLQTVSSPEGIYNLGLFSRWFCYFPNGQTTRNGESIKWFFLFLGDPLSKSKISMIILGNPCFRSHVEFRRCNFAKCDGLYGFDFGSWKIMGIFMGNDPTVGLNQVWDLKPITYNWTGWCFGTMEFRMTFQFSWECHHPNWLSLHHFSEGLAATTSGWSSVHQTRWNPRLPDPRQRKCQYRCHKGCQRTSDRMPE